MLKSPSLTAKVNWLLGVKIDLAKSFIIGDRFIYHVDCGCDAGCKNVFADGDIKKY
jgi:hypothetical protein